MKKYNYIINGVSYEVTISEESESAAKVTVNGEQYAVEKVTAPKSSPSTSRPVRSSAPIATPHASPQTPTPAPSGATNIPAGATKITAPLPGTVTKIEVKEGDIVKNGQVVVHLDAMKMDNEVMVDRDGRVLAVRCVEGSSVMEGDLLLVIGE
ncbi:MAG: biotin/lipoyl-containing protein [Bacteroides sp.]|jgi:biotin carboxyl carrier protein